MIYKNLKKEPNLKNYAAQKASFKWSQAAEEIAWFDQTHLNAAFNAIDVPATKHPEKTALIWLGEQGQVQKFSFKQMSELSNQFASFLVKKGLKEGERVFFFLPRVPEIYFGFLGAIKAGGVTGTFFPAFNEQALEERLVNSSASFLVTDQELGQRVVPLRSKLKNLREIIYVDTSEFKKDFACQPKDFSVVKTKAEDPAIMLYTSATGQTPVCGIVLPQKAIISQKKTAWWVLDLQPEDIYWCTADPGWITGIAYGILGNWANGITTLVYEGRFDVTKWLEILADYQVSVWYTAPTALRMLSQEDEAFIGKSWPSLRHLCSVGEALEPNLITWSLEKFGLPLHDTYWQTETGSMMLVNFPSEPIVPGSMGKPVPGIEAAVIDEKGQPLPAGKEGELAFRSGWPAEMIDVWQNHPRFEAYHRGPWFITGDRAKYDLDGYFYFVGRTDDVIKTSGERVGPFEVESALTSHPAVVEAGVIGKPDPLRGEIIKAFVVLKKGYSAGNELKTELQQFVKQNLAGHAYPKEIEFVADLPKNRSGKIVRRILKAKELGLPLGDTSTLI